MHPHDDTEQDAGRSGGPTPVSADVQVGLLLAGRYRITAELGHGAASTVYQANDQNVAGRQVALKVARRDHRGLQASRVRTHLVTEVQALAPLSHPALPTLIDVVVDKGRYSIVLEYLPGETLAQVAAHRSIAVTEVLDWALRLCDVLVYLHGHPHRPLTHGAVDSTHCWLLPQGRLVLFDFGTAAGATDVGRWQDVRALAVLCTKLLNEPPSIIPASGETAADPQTAPPRFSHCYGKSLKVARRSPRWRCAPDCRRWPTTCSYPGMSARRANHRFVSRHVTVASVAAPCAGIVSSALARLRPTRQFVWLR